MSDQFLINDIFIYYKLKCRIGIISEYLFMYSKNKSLIFLHEYIKYNNSIFDKEVITEKSKPHLKFDTKNKKATASRGSLFI